MTPSNSNDMRYLSELRAWQIGDLCQHCQERPSTTRFSQDGGSLDFAHGLYQVWCDVCVLERQIEYARERAAKIPEMERKLEEAKRR